MTRTGRRTTVLVILTIIATLFAAWLTGGIKRPTTPTPKNIFDEIYYDIEKNYRTGAVAFRNVNGIDIPTYGGIDYDPEESPVYTYDDGVLPSPYNSLRVEISTPRGKYKELYISFYKGTGIGKLLFSYTYDSKNKTFEQRVAVRTGENLEDFYSYPDREAQDFLAQHNITPENLDSYNEAILNDVVLTDWTTVYNSRFSPDNYGDVEVTKQW